MSLECMSWAKRQKIEKPGAKLVLLCLADHASEKNNYRCWAGRKCIADEASMSVRTVTSHLNWLEEQGFIKRDQRFREDGSQTTNYVTLSMDSPSANIARGGEEIAQPSANIAPHEPVTNQLIETPPYIPPDRFSEFWDAYPKKVAKKAAQKVWDRHMKANVSPDEIIEGARRYAFAVVGEERGFIKHPQGWLNDERWRDDPEMVKPPDKPGAALDAFDASIAKAKANGSSDITGSNEHRDRRDHLESDEGVRQSGPPAGISQRDCDRLARQIGFTPRFAGNGEEHSRE